MILPHRNSPIIIIILKDKKLIELIKIATEDGVHKAYSSSVANDQSTCWSQVILQGWKEQDRGAKRVKGKPEGERKNPIQFGITMA